MFLREFGCVGDGPIGRSRPGTNLISQQHEEGIRAAITAGKDVYCEWPLTPTAVRTSPSWRRLADAAGVKTQIGLAATVCTGFFGMSHDLVAQGYGSARFVSARMHVSVNSARRDPCECRPWRWSLPDRGEFGERRSDLRWTLLSSPLLTGRKAVQLLGAHGLSASRRSPLRRQEKDPQDDIARRTVDAWNSLRMVVCFRSISRAAS